MIPRFARSAAPAAVEAAVLACELSAKFHREALLFASRYQVPRSPEDPPAYWPARRGNSCFVLGITSDGPPDAQDWVPLTGGRGWMPKAGTPARDEMLAISYTTPQMPGVPKSVTSGPDAAGARTLLFPAVFALHGRAWLGFPEEPSAMSGQVLDPEIWTPVSAEDHRIAWTAYLSGVSVAAV